MVYAMCYTEFMVAAIWQSRKRILSQQQHTNLAAVFDIVKHIFVAPDEPAIVKRIKKYVADLLDCIYCLPLFHSYRERTHTHSFSSSAA